MTYSELTSEGLLKDFDIFAKSLNLQAAVMFSLSPEQVHLVSLQTLFSSIVFSERPRNNVTARSTRNSVRLIFNDLYLLDRPAEERKSQSLDKKRH